MKNENEGVLIGYAILHPLRNEGDNGCIFGGVDCDGAPNNYTGYYEIFDFSEGANGELDPTDKEFGEYYKNEDGPYIDGNGEMIGFVKTKQEAMDLLNLYIDKIIEYLNEKKKLIANDLG